MGYTGSADKLIARAKVASKNSDWLEAVACYQSVVERFPKNTRARNGLLAIRGKAVPALLEMARPLIDDGKTRLAERFVELAHHCAPELIEIDNLLLTCQLERDRYAGVLQTAERILQKDAANVEAINAKSKALIEMGRVQQASEWIEYHLSKTPDRAELYYYAGSLARSLGQRQRTIEAFQKALQLNPDKMNWHMALANARTYTPDHPHIEQLQQLLTSVQPGTLDEAPLRFALFKSLHESGQTEAAFEHLRVGNAVMAQLRPYDFKSEATRFALCHALLATPLQSQPKLEPIKYIFVTGLPRSGTTLLERIISMNPEVQAAGELSVFNLEMPAFLADILKRSEKAIKKQDLAELQQKLRRGLEAYSDGSPIMIDKMPLNFRWIGVICATLPEARIVHIDRDPMAVAWSWYRNTFSGDGNSFAYDIAESAKFMALYQKEMAHWQDVCGDRICNVQYAELVNNTEAETKRIAQALGLAWSADWLTPERSTKTARTSSAVQVTKPIYKNSDDGWRTYETQLQPLRDALKTVGVLKD